MTREEARYNDGAVYNVLDDIEYVSKRYKENCEKTANAQLKKSTRGFIVAAIALIYAGYHRASSWYHRGAAEVYDRYDNIVEDSDRFWDERRNMK